MDKVFQELPHMYLNLSLAIILAFSIDFLIDNLKLSSVYFRIFIQFTIDLVIIVYVNQLLNFYEFNDLDSSLFFIPIFIGSQTSLLEAIRSLKNYES